MQRSLRVIIGVIALIVMFVILLNSSSSSSSVAVAEVNRSNHQRNMVATSQNPSGLNKYIDSL